MSELNEFIDNWKLKVSLNPDLCDIALFKIHIQVEKYFTKMFYWYGTGQTGTYGYEPERKLEFIDESHLSNFLLSVQNKPYIDYFNTIQKVSKHIFVESKDPFGLFFLDSNYMNSYNQIVAIRNYIAHESSEARKKYIKLCLNNKDEDFTEPVNFLKELKRNVTPSQSNYSYYTDLIIQICDIIENPEPYF